MFTGKSEVGRAVARRLGWRFVDTDDLIVEMAGKAIADIFSQDGEPAFRTLERRALREACSGEGAVIATGGGVVMDEGNRALMEQRGLVVCLEARPETIHSRLLAAARSGPGVVRPLLAGADPLGRIRELKASRAPQYAQAQWTVHTDALTAEEVADEVVRAWEMAARHKRVQTGTGPSGQSGESPAAVVVTLTQSYPVYAGWGIMKDLGTRLLRAGLRGRAFVVADSGVWPHYADVILAGLKEAGLQTEARVVPCGEPSKSLASAEALYAWLVEKRAERGEAIVAVGGGMVGDLAGFVAATYVRGMPFVQVPTSLLAMVDASIGGKVAVDLPQGKNLVGAFYQPRFVLADVQTLTTLPARELTSGWAEVVKHGLILDPDLVAFLESNSDRLMALEPEATVQAVSRSARIKAEVVSRDEKETGERIWLNYGHTVGHALEAATSYGTYLHGEAVALGMVAAAEISRRMELCPASLADKVRECLARFGLPTAGAQVGMDAIRQAMQLDKKVKQKAQRWVLLTDLGKPVVRDDVPASVVEAAIATILTRGQPSSSSRGGGRYPRTNPGV